MKYYLTTPLYYVNSRPHIGHSYTEIASDVLARYHRLVGHEVLFLTGTDEHGQKIDRAARDAGMPPQEFTDKISQTFRDLWKTLNISYDDFIRTTEPRHKESVRTVWERMRQATVEVNGKKEPILYLHTYDGYYCVSCETFITEGLLAENPNVCPDCKKPLERMKEDTYFFRLSAYQDRLMADIRAGKMQILPETRRNEVMGFLEHNRLTDLSVSRPKNRLAWGIPLPFDENHVTYVWFDALVNYISACGYGRGAEADKALFKKWWPADVHLIGKDIIRHHAVLWPIFLYALGVELPKMIFAHGWWVQGGEKMSKSRGNAVDPIEIVNTYGVDAYRYFLLRETPFGADGTFSEEAFILRYNTDLANDLGNLLNRSLTMCEKYFEGSIPEGIASKCSGELPERVNALASKTEALLSRLAFSEAMAEIWALINAANKYIESSAPWTLAKQGKTEELKVVIVSLMEILKVCSQSVWPFMPEKAEGIWAQLGISGKPNEYPFKENSWGFFDKGGKISKGAPLFPRIEVKK